MNKSLQLLHKWIVKYPFIATAPVGNAAPHNFNGGKDHASAVVKSGTRIWLFATDELRQEFILTTEIAHTLDALPIL